MPTKGRITSFRLGAWSAAFSGRCDTICDQAEPRKNHRTSGKIKCRTDVIVIGFVIIGLMTWKRSNKHITKIPHRGPSSIGREAGSFLTIQSKKKNRQRAESFCYGIISQGVGLEHRAAGFTTLRRWCHRQHAGFVWAFLIRKALLAQEAGSSRSRARQDLIKKIVHLKCLTRF